MPPAPSPAVDADPLLPFHSRVIGDRDVVKITGAGVVTPRYKPSGRRAKRDDVAVVDPLGLPSQVVTNVRLRSQNRRRRLRFGESVAPTGNPSLCPSRSRPPCSIRRDTYIVQLS